MGLLDLFRPAWQNSNEEKAMKVVQKIFNEKKLKEIAIKATDRKVRAMAIQKITDNEALNEIIVIVGKIKRDVRTSEKITINIDTGAGLKDLEYNNKQMMLEIDDAAIMEMAIKKMIENITDEAVLKEIVLKDSYWYLHRTAVKKITDEAFLKDIALKDKDKSVRIAAVEKITDETFLKDIALKDKHEYVRQTAVEKITDETFLKDIALKDKDKSVRKAAIEKITDEIFLGNLVLNCDDEYICEILIRKITNEQILKKFILKNSIAIYIRIEAIEKIQNQTIVQEIANNKNMPDFIRSQAYKQVGDERNANLMKVLNTKDLINLRGELNALSNDKEALQKIIGSSESWEIKKQAEEYLQKLK